MEFIQCDTIVIIGAWNTSIFTPNWVKKYLFPSSQVKMEFALNDFGSHRIVVDDYYISLQKNKLAISNPINSDKTYEQIQSISEKIADYLPHTPVSQVGINFMVKNEVINSFSLETLPFNKKFNENIDNYSLTYRIKRDEYVLNLKLVMDNNKLKIDSNYHFIVNDLVSFKNIFSENDILFYKKDFENILKLIIE